jgi:hypothetical protein
MNYFKTAILLAGLTGLFMGVGYLIGGASGAVIALLVAAATNLAAPRPSLSVSSANSRGAPACRCRASS